MIINPNTVLLLDLSLITLIIASVRYIVGFKTWKIYPPLLLSIAMYLFNKNAAIGLTFIEWLIITSFVILTTVSTKNFLKNLKINYYARLSVIYLFAVISALISATIITLTINPKFFGYEDNILASVMILATTDSLIQLIFKKDTQETFRRTLTTFILSIIGGTILTYNAWNIFFAHHYVIIMTLAVFFNIIIATWKHLRFTDFIRFKKIVEKE